MLDLFYYKVKSNFMERKLSKKEWIAVVVGVGFVGYTLFGGNITNLFNQPNMDNKVDTGAVANATRDGGIIVNDLTVGTGVGAVSGKLISAHYVLSLQDGTVIQNSKDFGVPFQFVLGAGQVIPGWEMGFSGMKVGGVRTIIIPPELAYGAQQAGPIPPNSTLVFTVELVNVEDAPVVPAQ